MQPPSDTKQLLDIDYSEMEARNSPTLAQDYLYCIEEEYKEAIRENLSRMSVNWGKFSRDMNLALRKLTKEGHPEIMELNTIYNIWLLYSTLLEINHKFPQNYRKVKQKRKLIKMIKSLRKEISGSFITINQEKINEE